MVEVLDQPVRAGQAEGGQQLGRVGVGPPVQPERGLLPEVVRPPLPPRQLAPVGQQQPRVPGGGQAGERFVEQSPPQPAHDGGPRAGECRGVAVGQVGPDEGQFGGELTL
ncbi:hypothetical protein GCM10020220_114810 [Nonomuraea rubra]|uniref:hypothetical protein n=1 Tax=Nonomuraea rubra TaxID=46180 RepID=UPI0031F0ABCD